MFSFQCSPPQVPRPRRENHEPESPLPHAVKSEIAQLTSKFTVDYANEGDDGCEQTALVCSISESVFYRTMKVLLKGAPLFKPDSSKLFFLEGRGPKCHFLSVQCYYRRKLECTEKNLQC